MRRDRHKMTAFVRFREIDSPDGARFVAWFEPDHYIEELTAPFFVDRFASMRFAILTPRTSILWDGTLSFGPGARREDAPPLDDFAGAWDVYYRSIFNPARLMKRAMLKEMPKKYWANLPETRQIPAMSSGARPREAQMVAAPPSKVEPGAIRSRRSLRRGCQAADARRRATRRSCAKRKLVASVLLAIAPRKSSSAKAQCRRARSSSASSPAIKRICRVGRLSDLLVVCCARLCARPASQRPSATSPTRSSISSSSRVESGASTRPRARARSITAAGGWTRNSPWWNRRSSSRSARARFALWRGRRRGLLTCGDALLLSARARCCRRSIPPISFDCRTRPQKRRRLAPSPTTSGKRVCSRGRPGAVVAAIERR